MWMFESSPRDHYLLHQRRHDPSRVMRDDEQQQHESDRSHLPPAHGLKPLSNAIAVSTTSPAFA